MSVTVLQRWLVLLCALMLLLTSGVAAAFDLGGTWRLADAQRVLLPGTKAEAGGDFRITAAAFSEWHLPAPGVLGLALADHDEAFDANAALEVYRSNGSGLLIPVPLQRDSSTGLWRLAGFSHDHRLVHLRARGEAIRVRAFYLQAESLTVPLGVELQALERSPVRVRRHRLDFPQEMLLLAPGETVRFPVADAGAVRLRLRMPFADRERPWQDHQIRFHTDGKPLDAVEFRSVLDRSRSWVVGGEETLLGLADNHFLELPPGTRELELRASHPVLVRLDAVRAQPYLLPEWNHLAPAGPGAGQLPAELVSTLAAQSAWRERQRLATSSLLEDAPLLAAARSGAGSWLEEVQERDRLFARYTSLQTLLPAAAADERRPFEAFVASYQWPQLLAPDAVGQPRWSGARMRSSRLNEARSSVFFAIEPGATLVFPAETLRAPTRLRLLADRAGLAAESPLAVTFDAPRPAHTTVLLASERARVARQDPAALKPEAAGARQLLPALTGAAELSVPAHTRAVRVTNNGAAALSVALQLRRPRQHRFSEADWLALLSASDEEPLTLWWRSWAAGLTADGRWDAARADSVLTGRAAAGHTSAGRTSAGRTGPWLLLQHYLAEQASLFGSLALDGSAGAAAPLRPVNAHCLAGPAQGADTLATARSWQAANKWLNANEAWRQSLPALEGAACIEAHQHFAENLVQLGEHRLAERYWRSVIILSRNEALRRRSIEALGAYYHAQQLHVSALRLAAYVALRWREPTALSVLGRALLDAGQAAFGIDVALLVPERHENNRLRAALEQRGWLDLLAFLQSSDDPHGPRVEGFEIVSRAPAAISASASALMRDRLLDEAVPSFVAGPDAPLRATVAGPAVLRLTLRAVLDGPVGDRWALLTLDGRRLPLALPGSEISARFRLDEAPLGTATAHEITLGPGVHELELVPERGSAVAALSLREARPLATSALHPAQDQLRVLGPAPAPQPIAEPSGSVVPAIALPRNGAEQQALLTLEPETATTRRELMAVLTYLAGREPPEAPVAASRAEWLAHGSARDRRVAALRQRLRRNTRWQRQELLQASGGTHIEPQERFAPDSEFWRIRNLLLPEWEPGEVLVSPGGAVELSLAAPEPSALRFELTLLSLDATRRPDVHATLEHNGTEMRQATLTTAQQQVFELPLGRGEHTLRLSLNDFTASSQVKLRVLERANGRWQAIERPARKRYLLALPGQPLELALAGPAWVRVDQLTAGVTTSRFAYLRPGEALPPLAAAAEGPGRYRVFTRAARVADEVLMMQGAAPELRPWPVHAASLPELTATVTPAARSSLASSPGLFDAPTHTVSLTWHADDQAREDVRRAVRDYYEAAVTRREHDRQQRRHLEATAFARVSPDGDPSFGSSAFRWRRFRDTRFSLRTHGMLAGQNADGGFEWSAQGQLALRHVVADRQRRRHRSELKLFTRHLSADEDARDLDPDVYTEYADDHRHGAELSHRINVQPTWDSELFGELKLRSNEFDQLSADYVRSVVGARNQLGRLQLGSELQVTRYFEDDDRDDPETIPRLQLRARWYGAPARRGRLELRGTLGYDFERDSTIGSVQLLWHFDGHQGLDDFHAERYWFDPLLEQRLLGEGLQAQGPQGRTAAGGAP